MLRPARPTLAEVPLADLSFIGANRPGLLMPAKNATQMPLEEVTIAERLREARYVTFYAGKWHLGNDDYSPNSQGFGPGLVGKNMFYPPDDKNAGTDPKDDPKSSDRIANAAVKFIESHQNQPYFAYLPFPAPHIPVGAKAEWIEKYERKKATAPADAWGQERDSKVRLVQNHAKYAAMMEQFDTAIGRILTALQRTGVAERTIVIFVSDNGGLSTAEGHVTCNLPLRAGKGWLYEGGIRVPWIVRAPSIAKPGSVCEVPVISTDHYPTLLELAGLPLNPAQHRDGESYLPLLKGSERPRGAMYWHYPHYGNQGGAPGGAIRDGDWKLIEWFEDGKLELFNIKDDVGERMDQARANPAKAKELREKLLAWRKSVDAILPTANPNGTEDAAKFKKRMQESQP